ncbi:MAG: hypothetical protein ACM3TU_03145 [Bacillota bacterium]
MKDIAQLYTPREVEERIDVICRHRPDLREKAQGNPSPEERTADPGLDAAYLAYERLGVLRGEIAEGIRDERTGMVQHRV